MMLNTEMQKLQQLRLREIELLRSRVVTLGHALEVGPRQWVQEHPYLATGGAAVMGYLAAQIPPASFRKATKPPLPIPAAQPICIPVSGASPVASSVIPPAPAAPSNLAQFLPLLVNLAEQFLQPPPESRPATLRIADAGAVAGAAFPENFGASAASASS